MKPCIFKKEEIGGQESLHHLPAPEKISPGQGFPKAFNLERSRDRLSPNRRLESGEAAPRHVLKCQQVVHRVDARAATEKFTCQHGPESQAMARFCGDGNS